MKYTLLKIDNQLYQDELLFHHIERPRFEVVYVADGNEVTQTKYVQTRMISFNSLQEKLDEIEEKAGKNNKIVCYYRYNKWDLVSESIPPAYFVRYAEIPREIES
jgi:hypothetical protein